MELLQNEEESILKELQLDLIYAQSSYPYTIKPYAPRVGSSRKITPWASHAGSGVIFFVTHHSHMYKASLSMSSYSGNTPSVSQPRYATDFSHAMDQYGATPSYESSIPNPHIHGLNCLAPSCNGEMVGFETPLAAPTYYQPPVQPTYVLAMNTLVPQG